MTQLPENPDFAKAFASPELSAWREAAESALKGADFERSLYTQTLEGLTIQPLYTRDNSPANLGDGRRDSRPGWEMAQEIGAREPGHYADSLRTDLKQGLTGLSLDLDVFAAESNTALQTALTPLKPGRVALHLRTSQPMAGLIALESWLDAQSGNWSELRGSFCSDGLAILAQHGELAVTRHYDSLVESLRFMQQRGCPMRAGIDATPYHEAGAHAATELACAMAALVEQTQQLAQRGFEPGLSLRNVSLRLGSGVSFFMELAKFRAARVLFKRIAHAYHCPDAQLQIQARTSRLWLTRLDPYNNFLRQTLGALAAVIGGVDVLTTGTYNEASGPGDDFARRLARNLQLILSAEVKLDHLADPAGGSYFVEELTSELAAAAWKEFQTIESAGGLISALTKDIPQTSIRETARKRLERVHSRKQPLIGTNVYANPAEEMIAQEAHNEPALAPLPDVSTLNLSSDLLASGRAAFAGGASWPSLAKALAGPATVTATPLSPLRLAAGFEALREQAQARNFSVLLLPLGEPKDYRARVDFCRGLFEAGGMQVLVADASQTAEEVLAQIESVSSNAFVLCSSDTVYEHQVPELAPHLKAAHPQQSLLLAGKPKARAQDYAQAGIDEFVQLGGDTQALLSQLLGAA